MLAIQIGRSTRDVTMERSEVREAGAVTLRTHKADWEELASFDPMWAVLSQADKRGNRWEAQEFFRTGQREIDQLMSDLSALPIDRAKALDFGCGLGRLTRGLQLYFREAHGVDVAANMIEKAREFAPQCHFHLNEAEDLSLFSDGTFNLVYSNRVLQHLPSAAMICKYVSEFFRVTVPGGIVVFQVPYRKSYRNTLNLKRSAYHLLKALGFNSEVILRRYKLHPMRMTAVSQDHVCSIIRESGGELIRQVHDSSAHFAVLYYCRKAIQ